MKMELIKYRDAGMQTHTYFWKDEKQRTVSPFFDSEEEAKKWAEEKPEPKIREDEKAFDEAWAELQKRQTWKDST